MADDTLSSDANIPSTGALATTPPSAESPTESTGSSGPDNSEHKVEADSRDERADPGDQSHSDEEEEDVSGAPPLPDEEVPPLPDEAPPGKAEDDGWEPVWDGTAQAYYFYNRLTGVSQWENPRVPETSASGAPVPGDQSPPTRAAVGGYNPAIHGDYDPTAPYAQQHEPNNQATALGAGEDSSQLYAATGAFNRFTGKWQDTSLTPENFNDENKSRRQMYAFFDVDAAANSHDGRSLKAERSGKKLTKAEVKAFREKRRERKEEKRRAWLRD